MESTFLQFHCLITAHSLDELDKELDAVRKTAVAMFGKAHAMPAAMTGTAKAHTTRRTRATPRRKAPQRLRGTRRAQTGNGHISDEQMLSALEGKDGITGKELAAQLGISHQTALRKLTQWEKGGKAFRSGERNKTRWFAQQPALVT